MTELTKIDHVAIVVEDIARATAWYREQFNCEIDYQDESWAFLKFANIHLALVLEEQHPMHIAIPSDNPEAFGEVKHHRDGSRSTYIEDSEGNAVELIAY